MKSIRNIVDTILVPHDAFGKAVARLDQCLASVEGSAEPICIPLVGESRTGKSRVLTHIEMKHPRRRDSNGIIIPVLRVYVPSKPTVKGLAEVLLQKMGDHHFDKGTEGAKTGRLFKLVEECQTQMIMLDEFQHFYDKASHRIWHHVADWLKTFADQSHTALVVSGLKSSLAVINQNEQLAGRFSSPVIMKRFDWANDADRAEFIGILACFTEELGKYFDVPDLGTDEMAFRCYGASGGIIGYVTKLLRQAIWNANDAACRKVAIENLAVAYNEAISEEGSLLDLSNPFSRSWNSTPSVELLTKLNQIGTRQDPDLVDTGKRRTRGTRSKTGPRASQLLKARSSTCVTLP
jgi:hypothetical protein